MGMFDSLIVSCPDCDGHIEFQSKSGECILRNYTEDNLPTQVAIGMNGDIESCRKCNKSLKLNCVISPYARVVFGDVELGQGEGGSE